MGLSAINKMLTPVDKPTPPTTFHAQLPTFHDYSVDEGAFLSTAAPQVKRLTSLGFNRFGRFSQPLLQLLKIKINNRRLEHEI